MLVKAHPLVTAEWPWITEVPAYDFEIATNTVHLGIYVRRVSGDRWHTLAGLVNHVVVAQDMRRRGLGAEAVSAALVWLEAVGVPYALLHCYKDGAEFYARCGFHPAPNFPAPLHRGERVSMMARVGKAYWPDSPVRFVEPW